MRDRTILDATATRRGAVSLIAATSVGILAACGASTSDDAGSEDQQGQGGDSSTVDTSDESGDAAGVDDAADGVEEVVSKLTLEQRVAQLFVIKPEDIVDVGIVVAAGDATKEAIHEYPVGGICYFGQNLEDPDQTRTMLANVEQYSEDEVGLPMLLCVDEEGGTVARIAGNSAFGVSNVGNMSDIGATGDTDQARDAAQTMASYLLDLGFNVDFAPVADIVNGTSTTMAYRSFGSTADVVAPMVEAQVEGFLDEGIGCCAKHFPGIGAAEGDSETEPINTDKTLDEMRSEELVPFQRAIEAGVPMVMVGHLSCPNVTNSDEPASLSATLVSDVLREELGFGGVSITDSLSMGAITSKYGAAEAAVAALEAGEDMILLPDDFQTAYQGVLDAVASGRLDEDRIDESVRRVVELKQKLADLR